MRAAVFTLPAGIEKYQFVAGLFFSFQRPFAHSFTTFALPDKGVRDVGGSPRGRHGACTVAFCGSALPCALRDACDRGFDFDMLIGIYPVFCWALRAADGAAGCPGRTSRPH